MKAGRAVEAAGVAHNPAVRWILELLIRMGLSAAGRRSDQDEEKKRATWLRRKAPAADDNSLRETPFARALGQNGPVKRRFSRQSDNHSSRELCLLSVQSAA